MTNQSLQNTSCIYVQIIYMDAIVSHMWEDVNNWNEERPCNHLRERNAPEIHTQFSRRGFPINL